MNGTLARIKVDHTVVGYRHIRDEVRERILSGKLRPNKKLPSTHEMAAHWNVNAGTVHAALAELVKEGLLIRQMRKGTFVREQKREERRISAGIYYSQNIWTPNFSLFTQVLHRKLQTQLEQLDMGPVVFVDPRPFWRQQEPWTDLVETARERRIQALITPLSQWSVLPWLNRLPIPTVHLTCAKIQNRVDQDPHQKAETAVRGLVEQGCRSAGLIYPTNPNRLVENGTHPPAVEFLEAFVTLARRHGLQIKNSWIRVAHTDESSQTWDERFGYEQFHKLWRLPSRPDGLAVFDDTTVRGVITALLKAQVRVPDQLKLVFQKNEGVQLLCPVPATFVVLSLAEVAKALIDTIQKQLAGQPYDAVFVPHRLEHAKSGFREVWNQPDEPFDEIHEEVPSSKSDVPA